MRDLKILMYPGVQRSKLQLVPGANMTVAEMLLQRVAVLLLLRTKATGLNMLAGATLPSWMKSLLANENALEDINNRLILVASDVKDVINNIVGEPNIKTLKIVASAIADGYSVIADIESSDLSTASTKIWSTVK